MKMTNEAIDKLIKSCDTLQRRTTPAGPEYMASSVRCFDACMRAFDRQDSAVESITFRVYMNAPVSKPGFAKIHRDGRMEMCTGDDPQVLDN